MRGPQNCFKVPKGLLSLPGKWVKDKSASSKDKEGTGEKSWKANASQCEVLVGCAREAALSRKE